MATASDLQQLYIGYFGRAADQAGLNFWLDAINNGGLSLANVHASFVQSAEYNAQYEGMTVAQKVATVYENVLGRVADAEGAAFWTNAIQTGAITEDQLIEGLLSGLSANDAAIISNKVIVANYYTSAKGDNYVEANKAEIANILLTVDAGIASVSAALNTVATVAGVANAQLASALATLDAAKVALEAYSEAYLGTSATADADDATAKTAINAAFATVVTTELNPAIAKAGGVAVTLGEPAANTTVKVQSAVTLAAEKVAAAQVAVASVTGLSSKVNTFSSQLVTFESAKDAAAAAKVEQDAEEAKFEVVNSAVAVTINANGTTSDANSVDIIVLNGTNLVLDTAYAAAATPAQLAAANALLADIKAKLAADKALDVAAAALNATGNDIEAQTGQTYTDAVTGSGSVTTPPSFGAGSVKNLVDALTDQKDLQDAISNFIPAASKAAEFKALEDAITAATTAIQTGLKYALVDMDAAGPLSGSNTTNEVFLVGDNNVTFGAQLNAGDLLFVGPGFKLGADLDNVKPGIQGDAAVLEVFITQTAPGAVVQVTVEDNAFGTNSAANEFTQITLTGITDLSKVSFDAQSGLINIIS